MYSIINILYIVQNIYACKLHTVKISIKYSRMEDIEIHKRRI